MKACSICLQEKPYSEYHKRKAMKDGHRSACKSCEYVRNQGPYRENRLKVSEKHNRAKGHIPLEDYKKQRKENKIPRSYRVAKRRAMKKNAEVKWSDKQYIQDLYKNAKEANSIFEAVGIKPKFQVDHIVPLQHPLVCGLHSEHNLQILTAEENIRKSNKFKVC